MAFLPTLTLPEPTSKHGKSRGHVEWHIIEGLKGGERVSEAPIKYDGYMRKRRKWPTKGWHKVSGARMFIQGGSVSRS